MMTRLGLGLAAALALAGCGGASDDRPHNYFRGRVYNGATGERFGTAAGYTIKVFYADVTLEGTVDDAGEFFVGPVPAYNDYTVQIDSMGMRSFLSHNAMLAGDNTSFQHMQANQSWYFDAYLFPSGLGSPGATLRVVSQDEQAAVASGQLRLRPTTAPSLTANAPAGVGTQVWTNDEDLQFRAKEYTIANGVVDLAAGELVYGVNYEVAIYNVPGHSEFRGTYVAGTEGNKSFTIGDLNRSPLAVIFRSDQLNQISTDNSLTLVFNQPIQFDPNFTMNVYLQSLDGAFNIISPDFNNNFMFNTLVADTTFGPERGVSATINGNTLVLQWNPAGALQTTDPGDPITQIQFGGLDGVLVRPADVPGFNDSTTLQALVGANAISVRTAVVGP
jgi:hypothetical protein